MSQRVFLVRHFATAGTPTGLLTASNMQDWLKTENGQGIVQGSMPSSKLVSAVESSSQVWASPLARAQQTAHLAMTSIATDCHPQLLTHDELREAPLPATRFPGIRLPMGGWDVLLRSLWMLGYSGNVEPRPHVMARAQTVAESLTIDDLRLTVTVIAHGFINIVLANRLRRLGWSGPRLPDHCNGGVTVYARH
jgi:broad specificity phosphatase PhoE